MLIYTAIVDSMLIYPNCCFLWQTIIKLRSTNFIKCVSSWFISYCHTYNKILHVMPHACNFGLFPQCYRCVFVGYIMVGFKSSSLGSEYHFESRETPVLSFRTKVTFQTRVNGFEIIIVHKSMEIMFFFKVLW